MDGDSDGPTNKFIVRGFVVVLESSPSTHVLDEESRMPAHNILQQLPKTESTSQYDSALGSIGVGLHHSQAMLIGVPLNSGFLAVKRIFVFGRAEGSAVSAEIPAAAL